MIKQLINPYCSFSIRENVIITFNLQSYFFVDIFHIFVLTFLDGEVGGDEDDGVPGEDVVAAVGTLDKVIISNLTSETNKNPNVLKFIFNF